MEPTTIKVNKVVNVFDLKHTQPAIIKVGDRRYKVEARVDEEQRIVKLVTTEDSRLNIAFDIHGDSEGVDVEAAFNRPMVYGDLREGQFFNVAPCIAQTTLCKNLWTDIDDDVEVQLLDVRNLRASEPPEVPLSQCETHTEVSVEIGGSSYQGKVLQIRDKIAPVRDKYHQDRIWSLPSSALCNPIKSWDFWVTVPIGIGVTCGNKSGVKISPDELMRVNGDIEEIPGNDGSWVVAGFEADHCSWRSFVDKSDLTI